MAECDSPVPDSATRGLLTGGLFFGFFVVDGPAALADDAHEDGGVGLGEDAAGEDAAEGGHHVVGFGRLHETDVEEVTLPHVEHALAEGGGGGRGFFGDGFVEGGIRSAVCGVGGGRGEASLARTGGEEEFVAE